MAQYDGSIRLDTKVDNSGVEKGLQSLKRTALKTAAGIGAGIGAAVYQGIKFESAFAGVKKTVNATVEELDTLRRGILDMSSEMPMAANGIAQIAESAGQLGIKTENILKFTRTIADLGVATNLTGEQAATVLARFANITQMPQDNFDRLGATIVALGNNLATTEAEIAEMALRLSGAGTQAGISEAQIMGIAGALSSVGLQADAGGSAFSRVISNMQIAVETANKDLQNFAAVAGMSADEFAQAFKKDAAGALTEFIRGLSKAEERGSSAIKMLDDMGISEIIMRDALLRASGAADVFTDALELSEDAWEENTALTKEAEQRYETLESKLGILKNTAIKTGIAFYDGISEPIRDAVDESIGNVNELGEQLENGSLKPAVEGVGELLAGLVDVVVGITNSVVPPLLIALGAIGTNIESISIILGASISIWAIWKTTIAVSQIIDKSTKAMLAFQMAQELSTATTIKATVAEGIKTAKLSTQSVVVALLTGKINLMTAAQILSVKAQTALNAVWKANPVGLVIAGVAALAAGIYAVTKAVNKETEEEKKLAEAHKANKQAIDDRAAAYKSMLEQQGETISAATAEFDYLERLAGELQTLADENGRVDAANRARAQFILGELNEALGTEYTMTDNIIDNYQGLQTEIYKLIEAKQLETLMDAARERYENAIKNKATAIREEAEAYKLAAPALQQLNEIYPKLVDARNEYTKAVEEGDVVAVASAMTLASLLDREYDKIYNENAEKIESWKEAKTAVENCTKDETGYIEASTAALEGNTEKALDLLNQQSGGYLTLEQATEKYGDDTDAVLNEMSISYVGSLNELRAALKSYTEAPSEAGLKAVQDALVKVEGAQEDFKAAGGKIVNGVAEGANGEEIDLNPLLDEIAGYETDFNEKGITSGENYSSGVATGIRNGKTDVIAAAIEVMQSANTAGKNAIESGSPSKKTAREIGKPFSQGVAIGISDNAKLAEDAAAGAVVGAVGAAKEAGVIRSPSRLMRDEVGKPLVDGIAVGIIDNEYKVSDAIQNLFDNLDLELDVGAIDEAEYYRRLEFLRDEHIKAGTKQWWDYTKKLIDYEKKVAEEAEEAAEEAAKAALEAFTSSVEERESLDDREYELKKRLGKLSANDEAAILKSKAARYRESAAEIMQLEQISYDERKKLAREYLDESTDAAIEAYTILQDSVSQQYTALADELHEQLTELEQTRDDLMSQQDTFAQKMRDYLPTTVGIYDGDELLGYALPDLSKSIDGLREYNAMLEQVRQRTGGTDIFALIRDMSIEEGTRWGQTLLGYSDEDLNAYLEEYKKTQAYIADAAGTLYQDEFTALDSELNTLKTELDNVNNEWEDAVKQMDDDLKAWFGDVPDGFYDCGFLSADSFASGFQAALDEKMAEIRQSFAGFELSITPGYASTGSQSVIYNNGDTVYNLGSSGETTTERLEAIRRDETIRRLGGV